MVSRAGLEYVNTTENRQVIDSTICGLWVICCSDGFSIQNRVQGGLPRCEPERYAEGQSSPFSYQPHATSSGGIGPSSALRAGVAHRLRTNSCTKESRVPFTLARGVPVMREISSCITLNVAACRLSIAASAIILWSSVIHEILSSPVIRYRTCGLH